MLKPNLFQSVSLKPDKTNTAELLESSFVCETIGSDISVFHSPRWCASFGSESSSPVSRAFYMLRVIRSRIFTSLQTAVKYLDIPESCFSTLVSRETLSANLIDFVLEGRENIQIWQKLTWFVCSYCGSHQIKMILILLCFLGEWSATLQAEWPRTSSPPGPG